MRSFIRLLLLVAACTGWMGCVRPRIASPSEFSADYVIGEDAIGVIACHGRDGQLIERGQDASSIIQHAIDRLPVGGGKIYISAGTYDLTRTLHAEGKHGIHIQGAARGILFASVGGTLLKSSKDIDVLQVGNASGITLSDFHITGSGPGNGKAGILAVGGHIDIMTLQNIGVNNCGIGIHLSGRDGLVDATMIQCCDPQANGIGLKIERCHYAQIVGGQFTDCRDYGIYITSPETGFHRTQGVKITSVSALRNGKAAVFIGRNSDSITLSGGCDFAGSGGSGIVISDEGGTGRPPRNILISGNHIYNNGCTGIDVGNADDVLISTNIISNHNHIAASPRQRHGIRIAPDAGTVLISNNIEYGSRESAVKDERKRPSTSPVEVLFEFDHPSLEGWKTTGDAWGIADASKDRLSRSGHSRYFADSLANGESRTGTIASPPFVISGKTISFLAGGWIGCGQGSRDLTRAKNWFCLKLAKTGQVLRTAYPEEDSVDFEPITWSVSDLMGQEVVFEATDSCTDNGYAWIAFDHIVMK